MIILIIVIVIIAIPFIAALFLSRSYVIERRTIINRPKQQVFDFIRLLENHKQFNKWSLADPGIRTEIKGPDGKIGTVYTWDSDTKNVGKGGQQIIAISEGQRIDYELRFIKPFESKAGAYMITTSEGTDKTSVAWAFTGNRGYFNRVMHFVLNLEKMLGNDLQAGLDNLKTILEK